MKWSRIHNSIVLQIESLYDDWWMILCDSNYQSLEMNSQCKIVLMLCNAIRTHARRQTLYQFHNFCFDFMQSEFTQSLFQRQKVCKQWIIDYWLCGNWNIGLPNTIYRITTEFSSYHCRIIIPEWNNKIMNKDSQSPIYNSLLKICGSQRVYCHNSQWYRIEKNSTR